MLHYVKDLHGLTLHAKDGDIGSVDEFYFDDEKWVVRYLIARTGGWLSGRLVLISPISIGDVDWAEKKVDVNLTREEVEGSPEIDLKKPVSRQEEALLYEHYAWPYYWGGIGLWGGAMYPAELFVPPKKHGITNEEIKERLEREEELQDSHLRSTKEVTGYYIQALDGEIGHLQDFVVEEETWAVRYFIVDTKNWLPGKKVIFSTEWIDEIVWEDAKVRVDLDRAGIEKAPEFDTRAGIERDYETELHNHYDKPTYW
jgi:hypothetical protein